jgi:hypothetical protein
MDSSSWENGSEEEQTDDDEVVATDEGGFDVMAFWYAFCGADAPPKQEWRAP